MKEFGFWFAFVVSVLLFMEKTTAGLVLFDFEDVPYSSDAEAIETYMEDIYGSDITVIGAQVGSSFFSGPLGNDKYIHTIPRLGSSWLSISFNEVPITSASFDFGMILSSFHAFADDEGFLSRNWHFWTSDNSGTIYFDLPVTTLKFRDSWLGVIEVDNLAVTPVPEPATLFLLGLGCLALQRKRRTR